MDISLPLLFLLPAAEKILDRNLTSIVEYVDIDHIRPMLVEQGIILSNEHEQLVQHSEGSNRNNKILIENLVGMLRRKGSRGIRGFIEALDKTSKDCIGHESVVDVLKEDSGFEHVMNCSDDIH